MKGTTLITAIAMIGVIELTTGVVSKAIKGATISKIFNGKAASAEKVGELFDVMNQRICDLEDEVKELKKKSEIEA